jgi:hypothetical protein
MQCCLLVVKRLRPVLKLDDPTKSQTTGPIAKRWQRESGVPDKEELAAIKDRGRMFKQKAANATLLVLPARAGDKLLPGSATDIAAMINRERLARAAASQDGPNLEIAASTNQQAVLWSMARALGEHVKEHAPDADYVLFADYLAGPDDVVRGVHFAVCNKQGELVIVDLQNDHWPDFKSIDPKTPEDCDKLVVKRLAGYCK